MSSPCLLSIVTILSRDRNRLDAHWPVASPITAAIHLSINLFSRAHLLPPLHGHVG